MIESLFGTYFCALLWNIGINFRTFHRIAECSTFSQYQAIRQNKTDWQLYIEVISSFYIITFLGLNPHLSFEQSYFTKFLLFAYLLYITYRFTAALLQRTSSKTSSSQTGNGDDDLSDELAIFEEVIDIKKMLLLEPIAFIILEATILTLSVILLLAV